MPAATRSVASTGASQSSATQPDWSLIGGAAALGGIALLGLGAATRRRRPTDDVVAAPLVAPASRVVTREPVLVAPMDRPVITPMPVPAMMAPASTSDAPGSHTAAAYNGPTANNPFLTLRARMRRARFLDQRSVARPSPVVAAPNRVAPASQAAADQRQTVYVMGKNKAPSFGFRLGWSKS